MSEMQEGIQMAMMTGQAMAFVVDKGVTLTRQIFEALAKLKIGRASCRERVFRAV